MCAPLPGRREQGEGEEVRRDGHERPRGVRLVAERAVVLDLPVRRGILQQRTDHAGAELEARGVRDDGLHAARFRPGAHDRDRLRVASLGDHEHRRRAGGYSRDRFGQVHRFGGGGGFIEEGGVGDRQGGEVGDERLEVEQRLEPSLRDLRLVRRVGGVPARVLHDVALDDLRRERVVIAHPDVRPIQLVLGGEAAERLEHLALGPPRRQRQRAPQADVLRHDGVDERVERLVPQRGEHAPRLVGPRSDVAGHEAVGGGERSADGRHERDGLVELLPDLLLIRLTVQ